MNSKSKICFDFVCDESIIFSNIAWKFQLEGFEVCGLILGNRWAEAWRDKFEVTVLDLDNQQSVDWDSELSRIAKQYNKHKPAGFTQADRFICSLNRDLQKKILVNSFLKIEQLAESGVNVFITTGVAYLYNLVILAVADHFGLKAISLYGARQPEPRFTCSLGNGGSWELVQKAYAELRKQSNLILTDQESYINDFRKEVQRPDYMKSARQSGGIKWIFIKEFILRLKQWYLKGWNRPGDYFTQHPVWYAWRDIKRAINKKYLNMVFRFDKKNLSDIYYIYPMHLQPEASTLVLGDDYVNQLETIKLVAKRLPADNFLYVKEHPAAYGRHSLNLYKELQKIYNVKLIDYRENVRKLIVGSKGVIVISGTMGWEALLLGIPSIVLGSVFYDGFTGTYQIGSIRELEILLREDLLEKPTIKDVAIALKSIYSGSFPGYFDVQKMDVRIAVLSGDNIDKIFTGLKKILD